MYIVIILLIIIWTVAIFGSLYSYNGDGDDECRESGYGGAGLAIGFIVWIIFILIFIAAVYYCQWAGVIFFLILTVLVGLGWFWVYQSRRDRRSESC
jgi:phosphatidylglycerophosphate synthase